MHEYIRMKVIRSVSMFQKLYLRKKVNNKYNVKRIVFSNLEMCLYIILTYTIYLHSYVAFY